MDGALATVADAGVGDLIQSVSRLAPQIDAARDALDRDRRLPPPLVEALRAAGLFGLWLPKALGGAGLDVVDFVRVIEQLGRLDGSVAWCASIAGSYARLAGYLAPDVAGEIFAGGRAAVAGQLRATGRAQAVAGGYRVTGRWAYGSGIEHSVWTIGICIVCDGDAPRLDSDGAPMELLVFFPTGAAEIIDTWNVGGLRGTGSHDYRVSDLFVAADHAIPAVDPAPTMPGALYRLPFRTVFGVAIASAALGIARAAIDAFAALALAGTATGGRLRDVPLCQNRIGQAEALLHAGRSFLLETARELWNDAERGVPVSMRQRALLRLANTQAAMAAARAVDLVYEAGGGGSVYERNRLERCFRDIHAATQHRAVATSNYELAGRVLLGLDPGSSRF